jgi:hypothetical protein
MAGELTEERKSATPRSNFASKPVIDSHHAFPHCSSDNTGVPAASSNSVTSEGSVSSRMAATMSGTSVVMLTLRLT